MNYTFNPIELCSTTDKQAHYFTSIAERNGYQVIEVNNRNYILQVTEFVWRAEDAVFEKVSSGIYVFQE